MDLVNSRILVHCEFFRDLERTVDVLKTDVVKRKVRLDPVQLESMEKELQSYTQKVSHMNCKFFPLCALNFCPYFLVLLLQVMFGDVYFLSLASLEQVTH